MAIRVTLSSGITSAKTTSLFQWDYGQQLEIVSDDLPSFVEVHFACKGMSEAVVVPCSMPDGTGVVTIPDSCLEQSTDITAWVYSVDGTQGNTVKTITIPIVSRIRPGRSETLPQGFSDQYTELISQINDAIGDLRDGTVIVKKAQTADLATKATSATNASFANDAQKAVDAQKATVANGLYIRTAKNLVSDLNPQQKVYIGHPGLYVFGFYSISEDIYLTGIIFVDDLNVSSKGPVFKQKLSENGEIIPYYDAATRDIKISQSIGTGVEFELRYVYELGNYGEVGV